jgi:hypothetical protein
MAATRRLAAILAADVAGYSRLMGADEEGTLERLRAIRSDLTDPQIATHRGRIVKTTGDGFLAEFGSTVDALRCAGDIQARMAEQNAGAPPRRAASTGASASIRATSSLRKTATSSAMGSMSPPALKPWPSRAASASRRGCRRTPPASSISPSATSASSSFGISRAPCMPTRSAQRPCGRRAGA